MMEKFGTLVEFDFLYHRSGPQAGQPRGYAFVTFQSPQAARSAMRVLDGRIMLGRRMAVKWAHAQDESMYERTKEKPAPPILSAGKGETSKKSSKKSKIAELEAKLKLLDDEDNLTIDLTPDVGAERRPTSVTYAFIERRQGPKTPSQHSAPSSSRQNYHHLTGQPYSKTRPATGRKH